MKAAVVGKIKGADHPVGLALMAELETQTKAVIAQQTAGRRRSRAAAEGLAHHFLHALFGEAVAGLRRDHEHLAVRAFFDPRLHRNDLVRARRSFRLRGASADRVSTCRLSRVGNISLASSGSALVQQVLRRDPLVIHRLAPIMAHDLIGRRADKEEVRIEPPRLEVSA